MELRDITQDNRAACIALHVTPGQSRYIASNEDSLATADENAAVARPYAIYADGRMVGFAMFAFDEAEPSGDQYWLWRFMIGAEHQGKGHGSAALREIIRYFETYGADPITLSTKADNTAALALYHKFGFRENGQKNGEEIVLKLYLHQAQQQQRQGGS